MANELAISLARYLRPGAVQRGTPKSVRYIEMPDGGARDASPATGGAGDQPAARAGMDGPLGEIIGAVLDLSAGEAQSLLVGDVGLAGSR